ncbi:hypothetical protein [Brachybacterium paraconglomeratum]|uniref:hypothetical protein n=1 Tax=Brachybacterium paraconglomeratum TaxID=173362 RepID=UPI0022AF34A2|nr:hypothetical protein [Brachybacterium paraconglomeratum]MCZ4326294.1 hypothetical protein [Brachybacterium paraconglomeratum]
MIASFRPCGSLAKAIDISEGLDIPTGGHWTEFAQSRLVKEFGNNMASFGRMWHDMA